MRLVLRILGVATSLFLVRPSDVLADGGRLGSSLASVAAVSSGKEGRSITPDFEIETFQWNDLRWRVPSRFMNDFDSDRAGFSMALRWRKSDGTFLSARQSDQGVDLSLYITHADYDLPQFPSPGLTVATVPMLASAQFEGMDYLGSISNIHVWRIGGLANAHVDCLTIRDDRLLAPKIAPDALTQPYKCYADLRMANRTNVHVTAWGIRLEDVGPTFVALHRELGSYIRQD